MVAGPGGAELGSFKLQQRPIKTRSVERANVCQAEKSFFNEKSQSIVKGFCRHHFGL